VFLADAVAGDLEYLSADEGGLAGVREIDAFCAGDPAGPSFYPAAAVFLCDVVRGLREQRKNFIEYCSLQRWLVSFLCCYRGYAERVGSWCGRRRARSS
jgi:hypothetical protein